MKKLILSVTAITGFSMAGFAQGTVTFDGSGNTSTSPNASTSGEVFISGVLDTSTDINAELLYSTTATGTFSPVVTLLLSSSSVATTPTLGQISTAVSDITFEGNGTLLDTSGQTYQIPTIGPSTTAYFEVEAWLGGYNSLLAAQQAGAKTATTSVFSEVLSGQNPPYANISNVPAINLTAVPEPSTLAMAGVGLASMLIFRRKSK